jgi:hypothetical protein
MTQITPDVPPIDQARSRRTGTAWLAGGTLWLAAGLLHADGGWRFDTAAIVWIAADVLRAVGLLGLFVLRPHGSSRAGTAALALALAGRVAFAAGEIFSILDGNDEGPLIPLAAMVTAVSMTVYGTVVLRRDRVTGPGGWSFLVMGLYPFVAMFPVFAITGEPSAVLIAGWGVPAALVGVATLPRSG